MKTYREVWEDHYGEIPKEPNGRSYHIHHINGDHDDNRIENLVAVTGSEHTKIHIQEKMANGTHHFQSSEFQSAVNNKKVKNGTHPFVGGTIQRMIAHATNEKRLANGTHHFLDHNHQKKAAARATRLVISMDDQKVTSWNNKWRHEKKTGYAHLWVDL